MLQFPVCDILPALRQFLRRMSAKLKWYGITEVVVPSFYTSSTDVRRMHADVHAALTLALWPILRSRQTLTIAA